MKCRHEGATRISYIRNPHKPGKFATATCRYRCPECGREWEVTSTLYSRYTPKKRAT